jgi:hypothetical protein
MPAGECSNISKFHVFHVAPHNRFVKLYDAGTHTWRSQLFHIIFTIIAKSKRDPAMMLIHDDDVMNAGCSLRELHHQTAFCEQNAIKIVSHSRNSSKSAKHPPNPRPQTTMLPNKTWLLCAVLSIDASSGYSTSSQPGFDYFHQQRDDVSDSNANNAMAQYEAALRAAASRPPSAMQKSGNNFYDVPGGKAYVTAPEERTAPMLIDLHERLVEERGREEAPSWDVAPTQEIHTVYVAPEGGDEKGKRVKADGKEDMITTTAIAGSALGTVVGSPLLVGPALGYAGNHLPQGEQVETTKEVLKRVGNDLLEHAKVQSTAALAYTQALRGQEPHDFSKVSQRILLTLQEGADQAQDDIQTAPVQLVGSLKIRSISSEDLKSMPGRSLKALRSFLVSEEVHKARSSAVKAIRDGLESDEMRALRNRAAQVVRDTLQSNS